MNISSQLLQVEKSGAEAHAVQTLSRRPGAALTSRDSGGFTRIELLAILVIMGLLVLAQLPALARVTRQSKVAQCSANLRQFALGIHVYANEFDGRVVPGGGFWAWDIPWNTGTLLNRYGVSEDVMYCPGTAPRFNEEDNEALYEYYAPGSIRVLGYVPMLTGGVPATNANATLYPQTIQAGPTFYSAAASSKRVLVADATISAGPGGSFVNVQGGYPKPHLSPHLNGVVPAGGNVAMLDGHVEWRKFGDMQIRSGNMFWW